MSSTKINDSMGSRICCLMLMLLSKCLCFGANEVDYIIKPTTDTLCPEEHCITLTEFGNNTRLYLKSNTTLIFLPGEHCFTSALIISNISKLSMTSNSRLSSTPLITCGLGASINLLSINEVYIGCLKFLGCKGHIITMVNLVVFENSTFVYHTGSAVKFVSSSNIKINECAFISNSEGGTQQGPMTYYTIVDDLVVKQNYIKRGVALTLSQSSVILYNCVFKDNYAEVGGAIYCELGSKIIIMDTVFENNYIRCKPNATEGITACTGAVLYSDNDTVIVHNSKFLKNKVVIDENQETSLYGSVLGIFDGTLNLDHCTFETNGPETTFDDSYGGVLYAYNAIVNISNSKFLNNSNANYGGVASVSNTICLITNSSFVNNSASLYGGVLYSETSSITIHYSDFRSNAISESSGFGGALYGYYTNTTIKRCNFNHNLAGTGGAILLEVDNIVLVTDSNFGSNSALDSGGVFYILAATLKNTVIISNCNFSNNSAQNYGGMMYIATSGDSDTIASYLHYVTISISICNIIESTATYGAAIYALSSNVTITKAVIEKNTVNAGLVFVGERSSINIYHSKINNNKANQGTIYLLQSNGHFSYMTLANNEGSVFIYFSNVTFSGKVRVYNCSAPPNPDYTNTSVSEFDGEISSHQQGGAITAFQSTIVFEGHGMLIHNSAPIGGAVHFTESKLYVHGTVIVANNIATQSGGGIYLYRSELSCYKSDSFLQIRNNSCGTNGGGVHAVSSSVLTENMAGITFDQNRAKHSGGGIYLELNSKLYTIISDSNEIGGIDLSFTFILNSADYGGAIYVADNSLATTCASKSHKIQLTTTECFVQTLTLQLSEYPGNSISSIINFFSNEAHLSGSDLFGGLLDRCTVSPFTVKYRVFSDTIDGTTHFLDISNVYSLEFVSSDPIRICFCNETNQPDCNYQPPPIPAEKGKKFTVPLVAVDQVNHTIPNSTIHSSLSTSVGGLGEDQLIQFTDEKCTELTFEVFSPHNKEQLILYADGPCKDAPLSRRSLNINFAPCMCLVGFQQKNLETSCECECNSALLPYIAACDPRSGTILRETNFWVDYIEGYLIYPHCPFDYCKPSNERVIINLNVIGGADMQCANNRSGLLCGTCHSEYSLSLGSSRCIVCPTHWPAITAALLLVSVVVGILLVALILLLNLTVAKGTLNGIIFYANVMAANTNAVFPSNTLISWLNLEIGFDVCFFDGMDIYWKTWLQFVFPAYLIFLVVMVIIISQRSKRFTRLIGRKNPVATLATIVFLSYAKLLQTIIASLSGTVLKYPGINSTHNEVVWLPDATVRYLSRKHIPLFIAAVLVVLVGAAYTLILFLWQWILRIKLFKWLDKSQKLSLFIRTYHTPYTLQHRYWTGTLQLARIVLYIVSAANIDSDPKLNLTATGVVVAGILLLNKFVEIRVQIYEQWFVEMLEVFCHYNLLFLCIATFFTLDNRRISTLIAQVSIAFTAALLVAVLVYHFIVEVVSKTKLWRNCIHTQGQRRSIYTTVTMEEKQQNKPTYSIVEAPKHSTSEVKVKHAKFLGSSEELHEILLDQNDQYS